MRELPRCIDFCAPQPAPGEAEGARCALDPCDGRAWAASNVFMCPGNYGCVPNPSDPGYGSCLESAPDYLGACEPDGDPPCPTQSYCRRFSDGFPRPRYVRDDGEGMCVLWVREGRLCNGDSSSLDPEVDLRCEPGTLCLAVIDAETGRPLRDVRRCQRPCHSDLDCPCPTATTQIQCTPSGDSMRTCSYCTPSGGACDTSRGAGPCCDPLASCQWIQGPDVPEGTRQCCRADGTVCESHEDCCGTSRCVGGACEPCATLGAPAAEDGSCCPGLVAVHYPASGRIPAATLCSLPCERIPGDPSTMAATGDDCTPRGAAPGCVGTVRCTPAGYQCDRSRGTPDVTCNGLDEDCDGRPDDDWGGGSCEADLPWDVTCRNDFAPRGRSRCDRGAESCEMKPFCRATYSGAAYGIGDIGLACNSSRVLCASDAECQPSEHCGPLLEHTSVCTVGVPGCCEVREGSSWRYVPCCTGDPSKAGICYYPTLD